jgi:hypothetical protein
MPCVILRCGFLRFRSAKSSFCMKDYKMLMLDKVQCQKGCFIRNFDVNIRCVIEKELRFNLFDVKMNLV